MNARRQLCMVMLLTGFLTLGAVSAATGGQPLVLTLSEAVETALLNNLGLRLRQQDVVQAEGAALAAEAPFSPVLGADIGSGSQTMQPVAIGTAETEREAYWQVGLQKRLTTGTEVDLTFHNRSFDSSGELLLFDPVYRTGLTLGLSQPLLKGRGSEIQQAERNAALNLMEANRYLVDDEAAALAAQVKNVYWELVFAHQNLEVLTLSLRLAEKLLVETRTRIDAGQLATIDIYQPESEIAVREQDLILGEQAIGIAEDQLKLLMNSSDWHTALRPVDQPTITPITPDLEQITAAALANRPDIKAGELQIKAAEWNVKKADNSRLPSLDLYGGAGIGGTAGSYGSAVDNSFNDRDHHWQIGIRFSHPLDNSLAEGTYRQLAAQQAKQRTVIELLKQDVRRLARTTVRDIELAGKTIEAATKTTIARRKNLEAEQAKFDAGRATTFDVLVAQQDYARALSAENRAKIVYAQTLANLDRLQGLVMLSH